MKYSQARFVIQDGDLFLFRKSKTWFGRFIRWWTQSPFSHVGVALWINVAGIWRLTIMEAVGTGVRLYPMARYVTEFDGQIDWYAVTDPKIDKQKVAGYVLQQWGKQYAKPTQFLRSFTRWFGKAADVENPDRFFCSMLVADAFLTAGWVPEGDLPTMGAATDPGSVALYPFLQRRGSIESD